LEGVVLPCGTKNFPQPDKAKEPIPNTHNHRFIS
jgi:hypothetical protein